MPGRADGRRAPDPDQRCWLSVMSSDGQVDGQALAAVVGVLVERDGHDDVDVVAVVGVGDLGGARRQPSTATSTVRSPGSKPAVTGGVDEVGAVDAERGLRGCHRWRRSRTSACRRARHPGTMRKASMSAIAVVRPSTQAPVAPVDELERAGVDVAAGDVGRVVPECESAGSTEEQDDARTGGDGTLGVLVHEICPFAASRDAGPQADTECARRCSRGVAVCGCLRRPAVTVRRVEVFPPRSKVRSAIVRTKGTRLPHCGGRSSFVCFGVVSRPDQGFLSLRPKTGSRQISPIFGVQRPSPHPRPGDKTGPPQRLSGRLDALRSNRGNAPRPRRHDLGIRGARAHPDPPSRTPAAGEPVAGEGLRRRGGAVRGDGVPRGPRRARRRAAADRSRRDARRGIRCHLVAPGTDRWRAELRLETIGRYRFRVRAWADDWASWLHDATIKVGAGDDTELMLRMGAELLEGSRSKVLAEAREALGNRALTPSARLKVATDPRVVRALATAPVASLVTTSEELSLRVERERAAVGSWYEFFPRSEGAKKHRDGSWTSGTFRTAAKRLPAVAAMGFDVVYLPPIHPIGHSFRKGPNNSAEGRAERPRQPVGDRRRDRRPRRHPPRPRHRRRLPLLRRAGGEARARGRARPRPAVLPRPPVGDRVTPSGSPSVRTARSPTPRTRRRSTRTSTRSTSTTTPRGCAPRCCGSSSTGSGRASGSSASTTRTPSRSPSGSGCSPRSTARHPEVVFLAEAFTRPAMLQSLAGAGFQQSYTYFTWRNTKEELEEFLDGLAHETADYLRPNLFVNTPDILTEYLQFGGPAAYKIRAAIAATAAPSWGVYCGLRAVRGRRPPRQRREHRQREVRVQAARLGEGRRRAVAPSRRTSTLLNRIRAEHPALGPAAQPRRALERRRRGARLLARCSTASSRRVGKQDTLIVVANVDPHSVRETTVHLDLRQFGREPGDTIQVRDLIIGRALDLERLELRATRRVHRAGAHPRRRAGEGPLMATKRVARSGGPAGDPSCRRSIPAWFSPLAGGSHPQPHDWLGQHPLDTADSSGFVVRAVRPLAEVGDGGADGWLARRARARRRRALAGLRTGCRARRTSSRPTYATGPIWTTDDPYRFVPSVGEVDLYLWGAGPPRAALARARRAREDPRRRRGHRLRGLGAARPRRPGHRRLQLAGTASGTRCAHSARGVWELFVPGLGAGIDLQVRAAHRIRRLGQAGRPDGALHRGPAGHRIRRRRTRRTRGRTGTGCAREPRATRTTRR